MTDEVAEVLAGTRDFWAEAGEAVAWLKTLPDQSVDLVFGSPPYAEKGLRYPGLPGKQKWDCLSWVEFMLEVTREARRVCRGDVLWVVNTGIKKGRYTPAVEGLVWKWYLEGRKLERPVIWHKNSPPNRRDWFSNDHEAVVCFPAAKRTTWNWKAIGTAPKHSSGGDFRQRGPDGERKKGGKYPKNPITKPRDVLRVPVGGGMMGHKLASQNEAPFPVKLVEPFVMALTNPGDVVCDCFLGSGSVFHAAKLHGRRAIGADLRENQVELTNRRMASLAEPK